MADKIIIVVYLIIVTVIGISAFKKTSSNETFYSSNGNNGIFSTIAVMTSGFVGGGYSVGNAAKCYEYGINYSFAVCGFSVGMILFSFLVLPKINPKGQTVGEVIEYSYGKNSRKFTAFFSFLYCLGMLSAQLATLNIIISEFFEISGVLSSVISAVLIILYSTAGGMNAVVKTDTAQFAVLMIGLPLLFVFSVINAGGVGEIATVTTEKSLNICEFVSLFIAFAVGEMVTPQLVQKLKITKKRNNFKIALILSSLISAVLFVIIGATGICAHNFITEVNHQNLLITTAIIVMPTGLKGFVGASLCAVLITSADTALNSAAAAVSNDLLEKKSIKTARTANVIIGILAMITVMIIPNVIELLMISYKFWCPVVFAQLLFALKGKRSNELLFTLPAISGLLTVIIWDTLLNSPFGISSVSVGSAVNVISFTITKRLLPNGNSRLKAKN